MHKLKAYVPFGKKDAKERMVWGFASTNALDSQGEVVKVDAIKAALPEYMRFGNIREMHQPSAVGKTKEASVDEKGLYIGVKIVDEAAWQKVEEGVYNGFSIGGRVIEMVDNEITILKLSEISLVDRPSNPDCVFDVVKMDGEVEEAAEEGDKTTEVEFAEEEMPEQEVAPVADSTDDSKVEEEETVEEEVKEEKEAGEIADDLKKDIGTGASLAYDAADLEYLIDWRSQNNQPVDHLVTALEALKAAAITEMTDASTDDEVEMADKTVDLHKYDMPSREEAIAAMEKAGIPEISEETIEKYMQFRAGQILDLIAKEREGGMEQDMAMAGLMKAQETVLAAVRSMVMPVPTGMYPHQHFTIQKNEQVEVPAEEVAPEVPAEGEAPAQKLDGSMDLQKALGEIAKRDLEITKLQSEIDRLNATEVPMIAKGHVVERFATSQAEGASPEANELLKAKMQEVGDQLRLDPHNETLRKQADAMAIEYLKLQR